jgi:GNAT superfamily N-acetyltransferase
VSICFVRDATLADADALTELINHIILIGGTTAHLCLFDAERMYHEYMKPTLGISCLIAESEGYVVGLQSLEWSDLEWVGEGRLPSDWAVIASFVAPQHHGKGLGKALFHRTKERAISVGVSNIEATIRADNESGLWYYTSLGFTDYARTIASPLADGTLVDRVRKKICLLP